MLRPGRSTVRCLSDRTRLFAGREKQILSVQRQKTFKLDEKTWNASRIRGPDHQRLSLVQEFGEPGSTEAALLAARNERLPVGMQEI